MTPYFCEKWVRLKKSAAGPLTDRAAGERHAQRQPFCEVTGSHQEEAVVQFADKWITVLFLDHLKRPHLEYSFNERSPGKLFLTMATYRQYVAETDSIFETYLFAYNEDGTVVMEQRSVLTGDVEEKQSTTDVSPSWDDYPLFGDSAALRQVERVTRLF